MHFHNMDYIGPTLSTGTILGFMTYIILAEASLIRTTIYLVNLLHARDFFFQEIMHFHYITEKENTEFQQCRNDMTALIVDIFCYFQ